MNIFITLDYELFFGEKSGTANRCILDPTNALLNILDKYDIKASFFVDAGYLFQLERQKKEYGQLEGEYKAICTQIRHLSDNGHGIELHVHPHWEDSYYDGSNWIIKTERYKLSDFTEDEVMGIVTKYTKVLREVSGKAPVVYRAGGWSAQPFEHIKKALEANGIFIDSTVYPQGYYDSSNQVFNFRNVPPLQDMYRFSGDLTQPDESGGFLELPISSIRVSPVFFWKFVMRKLRKSPHDKPFGDGYAVPSSKKEILRLLSKPSYTVVSVDGYKAKLMDRAFKYYKKNQKKEGSFVLIGHPKAFSTYSLEKLKEFIENTVEQNRYCTYSNIEFPNFPTKK